MIYAVALVLHTTQIASVYRKLYNGHTWRLSESISNEIMLAEVLHNFANLTSRNVWCCVCITDNADQCTKHVETTER